MSEMASLMQPSAYLLDNFVAHKMSSLTECRAPELSMETWLNAFILNSANQGKLDDKHYAYAFNIIRRAEGAFSAYGDARQALSEFIATPPHVVSSYFRSLLYFEICISQCWQGFELFMKAFMTAGEKLFVKNSNSDMERLHGLYINAKHMDRMIARGQLPHAAPASIWITNQGLESTKASSGLSFVELVEILKSMGEIAEKLSRLPVDNPPPPSA
jgi:hypothetical protein